LCEKFERRVRLESEHIRIIAADRSDVNREWFDSNFIIRLGFEPSSSRVLISNANHSTRETENNKLLDIIYLYGANLFNFLIVKKITVISRIRLESKHMHIIARNPL
jgi:hypothetical protein